MTVVGLPDDSWAADLAPLPAGIETVGWDPTGPAPARAAEIEFLLVASADTAAAVARLSELPALRWVQVMTTGYDDVLPHVPDRAALANAAGVHDASTAELAVGLVIAAQRGLPGFLAAQQTGAWRPQRLASVADRRVLLVGFGGIGRAVARRLAPFEVALTAVASRARTQDGVPVHAPTDLAALLPDHDVVVVSVPLTDATRGLVDRAFLAAMPTGALLVNVSRGAVVDTAALVAEVAAGRLRAALDVVDPEPLPADHPLWTLPGVLITPHVAGASSAFRPRMVALMREQLGRLAAGEEPRNVVRPHQTVRTETR